MSNEMPGEFRTVEFFECGCSVGATAERIELNYCPLHAAAEAMYEALEMCIKAVLHGSAENWFAAFTSARKALAIADGRELKQ